MSEAKGLAQDPVAGFGWREGLGPADPRSPSLNHGPVAVPGLLPTEGKRGMQSKGALSQPGRCRENPLGTNSPSLSWVMTG